MTAPDLPEQYGYILDGIPHMLRFKRGPIQRGDALLHSTMPVYTADQMRAYGLACIASRPAVQQEGWRPIETAPKDGYFLAFKPGVAHIVAVILDADHPDCEYDGGVHEAWSLQFVDGITHWMPLPPDPNLSPATPRPEDVSQKAGKDATYWHDRYCTEKKERKDWQERAESPTVEQAITALVSALAESKGWMRDYADSIIRDAIDRRGGADAEAIRREALEEAARLCEWRAHAIDSGGNAYLRSRDALDCALAIRALAAPGERNG